MAERRSLSVRRRRRGQACASASIASFFNNAPPARLACPVCGAMVPRLSVNQHLDTQCQFFQHQGDQVASPVAPVSPPRDQRGTERDPKTTSPYFKKEGLLQPEVKHESKVVSSLASKLCKRGIKLPDGAERLSPEKPASIKPVDPEAPQPKEKEVIKATGEDSTYKEGSSIQNSASKRKAGGRDESPSKRVKSQQSKCHNLPHTQNGRAAVTMETKDAPIVHWEKGDALGKEEGDTGVLPRQPYYLRNFLMVLESVLENQDDRQLFNQDDLDIVDSFQQLSARAQMLYVRLFQRKLHWLRVNKLEYTEIAADLGPVIQELASCSFLQTEGQLQDLGEALDMLPAPDLKGLAKTFHLPNPSAQKQQLVEELLRLGRQRSFFTTGQDRAAVILSRARTLAGCCVRVCRSPRAVFSRMLLLFSLADTPEEEEAASAGHSQLYTILLVNSGRLAFPAYTVLRQQKVFLNRDDLIRYEGAVHALADVGVAMQAGSWEEALSIYSTAKATWQEQQATCDLRHQEKLPMFLRRFTAGWTFTRILARGVEILQRLRRYEEAVEQLRSLLAQSVYCLDSRGRWWDRLALNLQQHLKATEKAIAAIRDGLSDPLVRTGHRLSLYQRAVRMRESPSCRRFCLLLRDLPSVLVQDVTHVTIRGQLFPHAGGMGKSVFLMTADEGGQWDATVMCSVEELALAHYRRLGFDQGIHGEGSTFSTLFGLLLWDIIFMEGIPDVFRNPYQTCPLDLHTDCFYGSRREALELRMQMLREASVETLHSLMADTWSSHEGRACALVSWERFSSLQQAQSLASCLGGRFLAGLLQRMASDYRHCRGGLPDLVVWSSLSNTYKLVEVKGPNDRLSPKQQIWLDELRRLGADVEVCHVTDIGARGANDH